ncbi:MAG: tetratricopeptide repeat protein [Deltaproteobacteria bacterium]|nr:tetratricopeptide repeat protein [Deltaproteobacteria bacterium]
MRRVLRGGALAIALLLPIGAFGDPLAPTSRVEALNQFSEVLNRLSVDGDFRRSAAELAEMESQWAARDSLKVLIDAEWELLGYIGKEKPRAAYPIAILFGALFEWYKLADQAEAAERAVSFIGDAGNFYRRSRDSRQQVDLKSSSGAPLEDPSVRSRNLSRIGLMMIYGGNFDWARGGFLSPAVRIDPSSTAPLHILAALSEKTDDFSEAQRYLEKLLQRAPDDAQAHLRLAMVQERMGKSVLSLASLESLIESEPPTHVEILALQEAIRLHGIHGALDQARRLLNTGRLRFPKEQSFLTLRLWLFPEEVREVAAVLESMPAMAPWERESVSRSARVLYNNWPHLEISDLREREKEDMKPYLGALRLLLNLLRLEIRTLRGWSPG